MRIVYMDEAGRGKMTEEPHFVVACAITHPDTQWHKLRRHYVDLANDVFDLCGDENYDEYVFHAKDIWHGSGDFSRAKFPLRERMNILTRLSQVPALHNVPVCIAMLDRAGFDKLIKEDEEFSHLASSRNGKAVRALTHAYCYARALQYVDSWMATNCPAEVAMVMAEDTNEVKEAIRALHEGAKKTDTYDDFYDNGIFVTKRIVDSVNFTSKANSPILQIADHCAFLAKRMSVGCPHTKPIWKNIWPQVWKDNVHERSQMRVKVPLNALVPVE